MTASRDELLAMLREGLDSRDWAKAGASLNSLKVRIHHLRKAGHSIVATPLPEQRRMKYWPPVRYTLVEANAE